MWYLRRLAGETPAFRLECYRPGGNSLSKNGASIIQELLCK